MDDDYVAQLMAKEAAENSKKYSLEGLGAYQSQKYAPFPSLLPMPYKKTNIFQTICQCAESQHSVPPTSDQRDG
jgi:hypothetical protein